jgi:hypothetical protein
VRAVRASAEGNVGFRVPDGRVNAADDAGHYRAIVDEPEIHEFATADFWRRRSADIRW